MDIWLKIYEQFSNSKEKYTNIKQKNLNIVFANTSKTIPPTSDSCFLILSHVPDGILLVRMKNWPRSDFKHVWNMTSLCLMYQYKGDVVKLPSHPIPELLYFIWDKYTCQRNQIHNFYLLSDEKKLTLF